MGLSRALARQLAEPTGLIGTLCGAAMDIANRVPLQLAVDLLAPVDGETILDAGCGTGAASEAMLRRAACHVIGIDQSATMIRHAGRRVAGAIANGSAECHVARLEQLPCPAGSIDAVLALNILYFCDADGSMIASLRRALRPGGRLVAYVTHRQSMENWAFTREGYHRLYDETALAVMLAHGGFDPADITIDTRPVAPGIVGLLARAIAA